MEVTCTHWLTSMRQCSRRKFNSAYHASVLLYFASLPSRTHDSCSGTSTPPLSQGFHSPPEMRAHNLAHPSPHNLTRSKANAHARIRPRAMSANGASLRKMSRKWAKALQISQFAELSAKFTPAHQQRVRVAADIEDVIKLLDELQSLGVKAAARGVDQHRVRAWGRDRWAEQFGRNACRSR
eukprot:5472546-Pleurochrysis_carterae.AAC.6